MTNETVLDSVLQSLNSKQYEAVTSPSTGVLQVVAGPGTGKTRVLSARVAHLLLHDKILPQNIIVTTFTKKAANEMKERLRVMLAGTDVAVDKLIIGTFHSISFRIIKRYGKLIGVEGYAVADEKTASDVLQSALKNVTYQLWSEAAPDSDALKEFGVVPTEPPRREVSKAEKPKKVAKPTKKENEKKNKPSGKKSKSKKSELKFRDIFFSLQARKAKSAEAESDVQEVDEEEGTLSSNPIKLESSESEVEQAKDSDSPIQPASYEPDPDAIVKLQFDQKKLRRQISKLKANGVDADQYKAQEGHNPFLSLAYSLYQRSLTRRSLMDFDDCLLYCYKIVSAHPVLQYVKHAFVDEFQDTNEIQLQLLYQFASPGGGQSNATVVGDPDQSIYAFRDAQAANFDKMKEYYENKVGQQCNVVFLEENYRSTSHILDVSEQIMRQQVGREKRHLKSQRKSSMKAVLQKLPSANEEARWIAIMISFLTNMKESPLKYSDVAVLVRTTSQIREFEKELAKTKVPYTLPRGKVFWEKPEVVDMVNCLRWISSPNDQYAFERTINLGNKGFGPSKMKAIDEARSDGETFYETLQKVASGKGKSTLARDGRGHLKEYLKTGESLRNTYLQAFSVDENAKQHALSDLFDEIYEKILTEVHEDREDHYENLMEVKRSLQEFEFPSEEPLPEFDAGEAQPKREGEELVVLSADPLYHIRTFVESVALYDTDSEKEVVIEADNSKVAISTIHGAKGLEWPVVFVAGLGEGLLPASFATNNDDVESINEERRCFYVAATRAQQLLYFTGFTTKGDTKSFRQIEKYSRFLKNLDKHVYDASKLFEMRYHEKLFKFLGIKDPYLVKESCKWYQRHCRTYKEEDVTEGEESTESGRSSKKIRKTSSLRVPPSRVTAVPGQMKGDVVFGEDFTNKESTEFKSARSIYSSEGFQKVLTQGQVPRELTIEKNRPLSEEGLVEQLKREYIPLSRTSPVIDTSGVNFQLLEAQVKVEPTAPQVRPATSTPSLKRPYTKRVLETPKRQMTTHEPVSGGVNWEHFSPEVPAQTSTNKAPAYIPNRAGKKKRLGTR